MPLAGHNLEVPIAYHDQVAVRDTTIEAVHASLSVGDVIRLNDRTTPLVVQQISPNDRRVKV
jgi:hypothetical protein